MRPFFDLVGLCVLIESPAALPICRLNFALAMGVARQRHTPFFPLIVHGHWGSFPLPGFSF